MTDTIPSRRSALAGLLLASLPGCAALLPQPREPRLYVLSPKSTFDPSLPRVDKQLIVRVPEATTSLNTVRIALTRAPYRIEYFGDVAWSDRAPILVQNLLVESFDNSRRIISISQDTVGLRSDFVLASDLREFQAEYRPDGVHAHVHLNLRLIAMPRRQIIGTQSIERSEIASGPSIEAIVEAFDGALGRALRATVEWTLRRMVEAG